MQGRTTIVADDILIKRVAEFSESRGITMSEFFNRAILNQLEKEGDFEIRDILYKQQSSKLEREL